MIKSYRSDLQIALQSRFADAPAVQDDLSEEAAAKLAVMAARGACRNFQPRDVPRDVIDLLCAVALSTPTKSDLQQRDIIVLDSAAQRQAVARLVSEQTWIASAPVLIVFCGNNRRQRLLHDHAGVPFANDHLDAFFNAAVDAAIALDGFVHAATIAGLGCCPISAVRNEAQAVSDLLHLPDHVFPVAGLAVGYPVEQPPISPRLPVRVTVHTDRYQEDDLINDVEAYDKHRAAVQPYAAQRFAKQFGHSQTYGWSEDKTRQYSQPERAAFGAFVRRKGFDLS